MLKSLMLAVACAYINPPGLQPNAPVVQATVPEILKQAYAMEPGTQKEIIIDHGDGLCSKVMIEPSTDEELNAIIDSDAAKSFALPCRFDDYREDRRPNWHHHRFGAGHHHHRQYPRLHGDHRLQPGRLSAVGHHRR